MSVCCLCNHNLSAEKRESISKEKAGSQTRKLLLIFFLLISRFFLVCPPLFNHDSSSFMNIIRNFSTQESKSGCEIYNMPHTESDMDTGFYQLPLAKFLHVCSILRHLTLIQQLLWTHLHIQWPICRASLGQDSDQQLLPVDRGHFAPEAALWQWRNCDTGRGEIRACGPLKYLLSVPDNYSKGQEWCCIRPDENEVTLTWTWDSFIV